MAGRVEARTDFGVTTATGRDAKPRAHEKAAGSKDGRDAEKKGEKERANGNEKGGKRAFF